MVSKRDAQKDDLLKDIISNDSHMFSWSGKGKRFLVFPVEFDTLLNITATHPAHLSDVEADTNNKEEAVAYNRKTSFDKVKAIYSDMDPRIGSLLALAEGSDFRVWKLQDMDEIPRWSRNRTVLLGDAAHPILPFGFSGASMSIEDAITLGELLPGSIEPEQIEERLKLYEEIRKPRVGRVRETGRKIAAGHDNAQFMAQYHQFLGSHDAKLYAQEVLHGGAAVMN